MKDSLTLKFSIFISTALFSTLLLPAFSFLGIAPALIIGIFIVIVTYAAIPFERIKCLASLGRILLLTLLYYLIAIHCLAIVSFFSLADSDNESLAVYIVIFLFYHVLGVSVCFLRLLTRRDRPNVS